MLKLWGTLTINPTFFDELIDLSTVSSPNMDISCVPVRFSDFDIVLLEAFIY